MKLIDRQPKLGAQDLVERFVPPPRFESARFDSYRPDPNYPSQRAAVRLMQACATPIESPNAARRLFRRPKHHGQRPQGLYLDGGYGVGKTHLLASLWHAYDGPKAYATFTELTAFIGFAGMSAATEAFRQFSLICIDEFELDDVANTLMVVSFLRSLTETGEGFRMAVTSNTLPDRLGEQRFNASDFKREIAAIAEYFDEIKIDGQDFRSAHASEIRDWSIEAAWHSGGESTHDDFAALQEHLRRVHPVQYGALLEGVSHVTVDDVTTIRDEDDALLWVQMVDKLYDARIRVDLKGVPADAVFNERYRSGGYRKKYGRAESRMAAMSYETSVGGMD